MITKDPSGNEYAILRDHEFPGDELPERDDLPGCDDLPGAMTCRVR
jgi:hypothetical protein